MCEETQCCVQPLYKLSSEVAKQTHSRTTRADVELGLKEARVEGFYYPNVAGPLTHPQTQTLHIFLSRSENK